MPARPERANPYLSDDERLALAIGDGDEAALAVVYERYHQGLYRYCRSLLRADEDASDAMQETFVKALAALRTGQRSAPLRPWLFRIAHNESMTLLRRRPREHEPSDSADVGAAVPATAEARAEMSALVADLVRLTDRQRSALVMRELSGLSHAEIGTALAISANAAKQAIFEARRVLHEFEDGRRLACAPVRQIILEGDGRRLRAKTIRAHLRACPSCSSLRGAAPMPAARFGAVAALWFVPGRWLRRLLGIAGNSGDGAVAAAAGKGAAATTALLIAKPVAGLFAVAGVTALALPGGARIPPADPAPFRSSAVTVLDAVRTPAPSGRPHAPALKSLPPERLRRGGPSRRAQVLGAHARDRAPAEPRPQPPSAAEHPAPAGATPPAGPQLETGGSVPQGPGQAEQTATGGSPDQPPSPTQPQAPPPAGHGGDSQHPHGPPPSEGSPEQAADPGPSGEEHGKPSEDHGHSGEEHGPKAKD